ncbi:hypothetical protein MTO96_012363 [Rhipicephalus appendiculatus]
MAGVQGRVEQGDDGTEEKDLEDEIRELKHRVKNHIKSQHPELLKNDDESDRPSQMTDDESSDSLPPIAVKAEHDKSIRLCRYCNTSLEKKEIAELELRFDQLKEPLLAIIKKLSSDQ